MSRLAEAAASRLRAPARSAATAGRRTVAVAVSRVLDDTLGVALCPE
jgi:hypothetical protein